MDIEHTLALMAKRPRMFVTNASGIYHFFSGVFAQKRDSGISKGNESDLLVCFLLWKLKSLEIVSSEEVFHYYDSMEHRDRLVCMAKDLLHVYREMLPSYIHPADRAYQ